MFKSQVGQDQWVYSIIGDKKDGFFVELGAVDGVYCSNTYYFEKVAQWDGICIEPNPVYKDDLEKNRNCKKSFYCISDTDDKEIDFNVNGAVSGIIHSKGAFVKNNSIIKIKTKTLQSVLQMYNAPKVIDYLSLDVEGHEYDVLKDFPFHEYIIHCITVEHNEPHQGGELRMKLRELLTSHSYIFIKGNDDVQGWKHGPIDDYYIHSSFL